jgi:hypothetical protein
MATAISHGPAFHAEACKLGLEGIVSKRVDAPYDGWGGMAPALGAGAAGNAGVAATICGLARTAPLVGASTGSGRVGLGLLFPAESPVDNRNGTQRSPKPQRVDASFRLVWNRFLGNPGSFPAPDARQAGLGKTTHLIQVERHRGDGAPRRLFVMGIACASGFGSSCENDRGARPVEGRKPVPVRNRFVRMASRITFRVHKILAEPAAHALGVDDVDQFLVSTGLGYDPHGGVPRRRGRPRSTAVSAARA